VKKPKCKHLNVEDVGTTGYTRSVAVHPFTHENPAAHGGACFKKRCLDCGRVRRINSNGNASEFSPWRFERT